MTTARWAKVALMLVVLAFVVAPASGQFVAGVRVIENSFDGTNLDIDFVEYYTGSWPVSYYAWPTAFIGGSNATSIGFYVPAIDWGDGNAEPPVTTNNPGTGLPLTATTTTVGGVAVRGYRGNFTHTYAAPPAGPVVVAGRAGITSGGIQPPPSNASQLVAGNLATTMGTIGGQTIFIATDNLSFAGPVTPIIEVPTASETGLLALALLLAGAAFVVLRRS